MTEPLYYNEPDQTEFSAEILTVIKENKLWKAVLDRTCFYPEGGGQPADRGWLNGIAVKTVQKENETIYHYVENELSTGPVKGKIDTHWRRDFQQQHTGQHIISGALWQVGKYKTVSVHMGLDYTTIEIEVQDIPQDILEAVEDLANRIIEDDVDVSPVLTTSEDLHEYPLRKAINRQGQIRLVRIGDFDCVGCGGLHLNRSGEVRLVKALAVEKIRGNTRLAFKIGDRALADNKLKDKIIADLKPLLSTQEESYVKKTIELMDEMSELRKKAANLETRIADMTASHLTARANPSTESGITVITSQYHEEDERFIKKLIKILLQQDNILLCLVNCKPERLNWSIGCSENLDFSLDTIKTELFPIIDARGGGRFPLWQGAGTKTEKAAIFLDTFTSICLETY